MRGLFKIEFDARRVYGLDILRAIAIITVMISHGDKLLPYTIAHFNDLAMPDGVFLFFVLSGFLIGGILIKVLERDGASLRTIKNFWIRRWFRTLPNYLLILTLLVLLRNIFNGGLHGVDVARYFFFVQNLHYPHPLFFSEAWTLSIEEWFYLTVPVLIFALVGIGRLSPKRAIPVAAIAVIAFSILFRLHRYDVQPAHTINDWDLYFRKEVVTRLDSLMFGVIGAWLAYYHKALWLKYRGRLFVIGLCGLVAEQFVSAYIVSGTHFSKPAVNLYLSVFSFEVVAASALLLLPLLSEMRTGQGRLYTGLTYISIISYSMYLTHVSLIQGFAYTLTPFHIPYVTVLIRYVLYWGLTIGASILLYKNFEKPTTNLREKLERKKSERTTGIAMVSEIVDLRRQS